MKSTAIAVSSGIVITVVIAVAFTTQACSSGRVSAAPALTPEERIEADAMTTIAEGRETFRHDTFGSENFYGGKLRLHEALATVTPRAALELGLKVDSDALTDDTVAALRNGDVNLDDPQVTADLLAANAVVGVTGFFDQGRLFAVGIQCALCHSTVEGSVAPGIGRRLDGWANRDLDVGKVIALAPNLQPIADLLGVDSNTVRAVLHSWGPGKFDAQLLLDGKAMRPDGRPAATLLPPAFGLAGVNQHTWTGSWGSVTYWNAFVANIEMQGAGRFFDPRLDDPVKYPIAAKAGLGDMSASGPDRITPKLAALHFYQLALQPPKLPADSFDATAAVRGKVVFEEGGRCSRCHVPPLFTEPGWNLHTAEEIGIDDFQAKRSPDERYRTAPLRGLWTHEKGGFYHDGRFATLGAVVEHYDATLSMNLSAAQKLDLVEYLRSL